MFTRFWTTTAPPLCAALAFVFMLLGNRLGFLAAVLAASALWIAADFYTYPCPQPRRVGHDNHDQHISVGTGRVITRQEGSTRCQATR